ncbi:exosome RNA helicase MTR4 [Maylandia zebra]|uniref:Exosome RNA helicase MTR4 n=3 Tax=Haplochromini TaxID=319058 RepID=A0A3Q2V318_HAPBU|nr:exosome RNA helicase MTR4 [Maylandia zebra]XP_005917377.1 exosome RNA helicase MTR4 [Haplochromis burtoni]XP_026029291.1 exosome RNA helicase MTR4 [Astatotilapia calliptera]
MADTFGDGLFSVFDDEQQNTTNKKVPSSVAAEPGKAAAKNETDRDVGPSARVKREADSDGGEEVVFVKKPRHEAVSANELNLAEFMPQVKVEQVETVEGCSHEVALPASEEYKPLKPRVGKAAKEYPFVLDPFQREAILCIDNNQSVLVSAHTSAGKTVCAEYAIALALREKQRVIFTSPIKALSNQKYREMYEEFQDVGLMTGDVTINPTASCLVMTTEILRSMLYRGSEIMREVAWVIFDEIHYMRDTERGVVWEETIILLPDNVHYVFLSATIPNAKQFAEWICHLHKQPCHVVYTDYRPTPLQHYIFPAGGDGLHLVVDENGEFREDNFNTAMQVLRDAGDSGGSSGGAKWDPKGRKGGTKGPSSVFKIVKMIMERNFQPVIIFSFSKKECEAYALQVAKLDFNRDDEKRLVEEVFNNAVDCLSDEDKKLPQVEHVLPLLKRGIGIHHGGLLPILKETIEILFSEGLLKALFATETFAMGINMPARTVLFTSARKFDGKNHRFITSGEYIQMSGRAGRRGMDDRGIVIFMVDEKMSPAVGKQLLKGSADPLNSAFHLTYNMVLNLLRVEEINPEYMLEKSFYQFQHYRALPGVVEKIKKLEEQYHTIEIPNEESVVTYFKIRQQLAKLSKEIQEFIHKPKYCLPFLQPGRLVKVKNEDADFGWGVVVNFCKKTNVKTTTDSEPLYVVEVLVHCSKDSVKDAATEAAKPAAPGETGEMQVVPVMLHLLTSVSSVRLYIPKDLRPYDNRQLMLKSIQEVQKRFPDGVPLLDPIDDMGIKDPALKKVIQKIEAFEHRMYTHPLHSDPNLESVYSLCEKKALIAADVRTAKRDLKKARTILQMDQLKCRKRVLRRLGFASPSDVIEMKGRVACEISSADELLLTEMMFNGLFNDLTVEQATALLSCFVFQENASEMPKLTEQLAAPLRQMQECAKRIAKVSADAKLEVDEESYLNQFKPHLMDVVYAWANGATFAQICKMTDVFEGSIIRCMRRLEEVLRQMCSASKAIGNTELENKFAEGITKIKRDIVFAASLYL